MIDTPQVSTQFLLVAGQAQSFRADASASRQTAFTMHVGATRAWTKALEADSLTAPELTALQTRATALETRTAAIEILNNAQQTEVDLTETERAEREALRGEYEAIEAEYESADDLPDEIDARLGEIEALPVADNSVDVILSNCVINLSPDKPRVFREAFRVLRSGGRLAVSDVVATAVLPADVRADWGAYTGCMAGASLIADLERMLLDAGFVSVRIEPKDSSRSFIREWLPGSRVEDFLLSAAISAVKP
jgi:SAM-dependent methyltransferase